MHRLSTILLAKKRGPKALNEMDFGRSSNSLEEQKRSFNRDTLRNNDLKSSKIPLSRSPEQKFLYVALALNSTKGPNCEDRIILRKMRFDKGGVVDLAQEKKDRMKYQVKTLQKRKKAGSPMQNRPNPKYREKAAKVVQHWWRELKDRYKNIMKQIILIQSFWRGRWVRKYMYDILYLSCMYQSFCSTIQRQLVNHIRPEVMEK